VDRRHRDAATHIPRRQELCAGEPATGGLRLA
jgi:hypothetical protein